MKSIVILIVLSSVACYGIAQSSGQSDGIEIVKNDLRHSDQDSTSLRFTVELASRYMAIDRDSAERYVTRGLILAKRSHSYGIEGALHRQMGLIHVGRSDFESANEEFKLAHTCFEKADDAESLSRILLNLGAVQGIWGNRPEAFRFYFEGLRVVDSIDYAFLRPQFHINMGRLYYENYDFDEAARQFDLADSSALAAGRIDLMPNIKLTIAGITRVQGDRDRTYAAIEQVIAMADSSTYARNVLPSAYRQLGELYLEDENYTKAKENFLLMLSQVENIEVGYPAPSSQDSLAGMTGLGKALLELGNTREARGYLEWSNKRSRETGDLLQSSMAVGALARLEETDGNYPEALIYAKLYKTLSDSLKNNESVKRIADLEAEAEYKAELQRKSAEQERIDAANKRREVTYLSSAIVAILTALVLLLLFRLQRLKTREAELANKNLQLDIDHKNRELASNVLYLLKKNELLSDVSKKLKKARRGDSSDRKSTIDEVIQEIYTSTKDIGWEEFELRFKEVHTDFYEKLTHTFPNLTPNELRLCAFLKLNMTTKDISAITFQSEHSIVMARSRLKKKLGIEDERLNAFLNHL